MQVNPGARAAVAWWTSWVAKTMHQLLLCYHDAVIVERAVQRHQTQSFALG